VTKYRTDRVVDMLLEGGPLPYPLDLLDRGLGSRVKKGTILEGEKDEEFIKLQKTYLRNMDQERVGALRIGGGRRCRVLFMICWHAEASPQQRLPTKWLTPQGPMTLWRTSPITQALALRFAWCV
jgi:hypothetical protein